MNTRTIVLANFGGPRNKREVGSFLSAILTDPSVTGNFLPEKLHKFFFNFIAKKRTEKISLQYEKIGGHSPIFLFTEQLANAVGKFMNCPVITFHRYLCETHHKTLSSIKKACREGYVTTLPLFPFFTHAVTGSIVKFFIKHLSEKELSKISWIKSFGLHPVFLSSMEALVNTHIENNRISANNLSLIFSAHGLPQIYVNKGDSYYRECLNAFEILKKRLQTISCYLSFQSKLGPFPWIKPYTKTICSRINRMEPKKKYVGIVPFGFISDNIETLFEIEAYYLPILRSQHKEGLRFPTLNLNDNWLSGLINIITDSSLHSIENLLSR